MTPQEFSNGFDTLLSSYVATAEFGEESTKATIALDEYEKSLFLTESQYEIVLALYTGKNPYNEGFEATEELRRHLAPLIAEATLSPIENSGGMPLGGTSDNYFFTLPDGNPATVTTDDTAGDGEEGTETEDTPEVKPAVWYITYESVTLSSTIEGCNAGAVMEVVPIRQDEFHRARKNPFRGPTNRRALRLDLADGVVEIICKYPVAEYYVRYLRKPNPIITANLGDASVEGISEETECELPESLHTAILNRAVEKALMSRGIYNTKNNK